MPTLLNVTKQLLHLVLKHAHFELGGMQLLLQFLHLELLAIDDLLSLWKGGEHAQYVALNE
jgi:hypothetical protein